VVLQLTRLVQLGPKTQEAAPWHREEQQSQHQDLVPLVLEVACLHSLPEQGQQLPCHLAVQE
jgi:hypothetical protein